MTLTALIANEWWPRGREGSQGEADFFRIAQPNKTKSERLSVQAILLHRIICEVQVTHCIQAACKSYNYDSEGYNYTEWRKKKANIHRTDNWQMLPHLFLGQFHN